MECSDRPRGRLNAEHRPRQERQTVAAQQNVSVDQLTWLDAPEPPVLAHDGGVLVWRDPSRLSALTSATSEGNSEVAGMMRKWGYSQPGK